MKIGNKIQSKGNSHNHINASKVSNLTNNNRAGTPLSQGRIMNKSLQKVMDPSKGNNKKNKSFRNEKIVMEKINNNYMKNNFFLKSGYNQQQIFNDNSQNSKSNNKKGANKNYTNLDIRDQNNLYGNMQSDKDQHINSLNMDEHKSILNEKMASNIKFTVL